MKPVLPLLVAGLLAAAAASFAGGCSSNQNQPPEDRGSTAGGNGAFGESPARPGSHEGDQYNQQGVAPATQPAGPRY